MTNTIITHKHRENDIKTLIHDLLKRKGRISFIPEIVVSMANGIEFYFIEIEDIEGSKFIINAYGTEALELFDEAHKCALCGKMICETTKNTNLVTYRADENRNMFVEPHCMNLIKKFEIAYGKEFFYS